MNQKNFSFKKIHPCIAMLIAMFSGLVSIYFATKLLPIFFKVMDLLDKGTPLDGTAGILFGVLCMWGVFTYCFGLVFHLAQKRVVEALYY
jgi:hypothetical protein